MVIIVRRPLDIVAMVRASSDAQRVVHEHLVAVKAYQEDMDKVNRLTRSHCPACHYFNNFRAGGATSTCWYCGLCGVEQYHGSTAVDRICLLCAQEHNLCTQCGGDRDMRDRRRKWPVAK